MALPCILLAGAVAWGAPLPANQSGAHGHGVAYQRTAGALSLPGAAEGASASAAENAAEGAMAPEVRMRRVLAARNGLQPGAASLGLIAIEGMNYVLYRLLDADSAPFETTDVATLAGKVLAAAGPAAAVYLSVDGLGAQRLRRLEAAIREQWLQLSTRPALMLRTFDQAEGSGAVAMETDFFEPHHASLDTATPEEVTQGRHEGWYHLAVRLAGRNGAQMVVTFLARSREIAEAIAVRLQRQQRLWQRRDPTPEQVVREMMRFARTLEPGLDSARFQVEVSNGTRRTVISSVAKAPPRG